MLVAGLKDRIRMLERPRLRRQYQPFQYDPYRVPDREEKLIWIDNR